MGVFFHVVLCFVLWFLQGPRGGPGADGPDGLAGANGYKVMHPIHTWIHVI